jgi:hypothetical protein
MELTLTLDPKLILKRTEPTQSTFIAVRFNSATGKTLLDRGTMSSTVEETKRLSEAQHAHRCVRIIQLETRVIRKYDTPANSTTMALVPDTYEDEEDFA